MAFRPVPGLAAPIAPWPQHYDPVAAEQAFAHGMGGGNPASFSMWINRHKVFSRHIWMQGYAESFNNPPVYDGVLVSASHITICATAEGAQQQYTSQPLNLASAPIDRIEWLQCTEVATWTYLDYCQRHG